MKPKLTISITLDSSSIKMMIRALTKYGDKKAFGSPIEQTTFDKLAEQLYMALFELQFRSSP